MVILLGACQAPQKLTFEPVSYDQLPGWNKDSFHDVVPAIHRSCAQILQKDPSTGMITGPDAQGCAQDWHAFCRSVIDSKASFHPRDLIQKHLTPYRLVSAGRSEGTITGYYEPLLNGSKHRTHRFRVPLYRLPSTGNSHKIPRSEIVQGKLNHKGLELVWVDDPVDAFFLQIQGSGKVLLPNGQKLNLSFAGQNGFPYYAIGKALVDQGQLIQETVSMQTIKAWLKAHPDQAEQIMSLNQSYVFFKFNDQEGPIGSQGVQLTPKRSVAVDPHFISLGTPLWLHADHPHPHHLPLQQLVVAQDTGGAIKGANRADLFWGTGTEAGELAGIMNSRGELYVLLPR
jgi:membrane-bound lytic murein transglycosylase A